MPTSSIGTLVRQLRQAAYLAEWSDGQLLTRYVESRDDSALELLVCRHGPMVLGVCRRILGDVHDADDAFQATFLVLVRKAPSINPAEMVGNWLYGVACQTAVKARAMNIKRRAREKQMTRMPETEPAATNRWCDLQAVLDAELCRLPEKYRTLIVLCDIEEKTRKQVAVQLGMPEGTVAGRLARARRMLADRLTRHGVVLSGGALALMLSQNAAPACVPAVQVAAAVDAAALFAAGNATGVLSTQVIALTEGVLTAMLITKIKIATAVLVALTIFAIGAGSFACHTSAEQPRRLASKRSQPIFVAQPVAQGKDTGKKEPEKKDDNKQENNKDDGQQNNKDDGQKQENNKDDGQQNNKDDGQKQENNKDNGPKTTAVRAGDAIPVIVGARLTSRRR